MSDLMDLYYPVTLKEAVLEEFPKAKVQAMIWKENIKCVEDALRMAEDSSLSRRKLDMLEWAQVNSAYDAAIRAAGELAAEIDRCVDAIRDGMAPEVFASIEAKRERCFRAAQAMIEPVERLNARRKELLAVVMPAAREFRAA